VIKVLHWIWCSFVSLSLCGETLFQLVILRSIAFIESRANRF
jgi:hypothetical protein